MSVRGSRKRLEVVFDLPSVSSDGGLLLIEKVDRSLSLTKRMASPLTDARRDPDYTKVKMPSQRVYGITSGWEDCVDFGKDALGSDPLYEVAFCGKPASQPTLSRFDNGVRAKDLYRMSLELVRLFGEISYSAKSWEKERRVLVQAELMGKGENPRIVVTNLEGNPEGLYSEYYRRGIARTGSRR